jgi:hypothetical protein
MGWQVGYDGKWQRDIGYGVPAICDRARCGAAIDRGLSYVCGSDPRGGDRGCGLYFCGECLRFSRKDGDRYVYLCSRCNKNRAPYEPTPDVPEWVEHKLADESWGPWRDEHPAEVAAMRSALAVPGEPLG